MGWQFKGMMTKAAAISLVLLGCSLAHANEQAEAISTDEPAQSELPAVIVTPGLEKTARPLVKTPGGPIRHEYDQLRENAPMSLKNILNFEPNVDFSGGPRSGAERPQIRGLGADRILMLDEGVRQNFQNAHNGKGFSDFAMMEEVEVVKGPWSSLYGSGAMGGVVNFRRSTAEDLIRRTGLERGLQVGMDAGSAAGQAGQKLVAFARAGRFEPLVSYRQSLAGDVRLGDGRNLEYSAVGTQDVASSLVWRASNVDRVHLKLNRYEEKSEVPLNPAVDTTNAAQVGQSRILKEDILIEYDRKGESIDWHLRPYARRTSIGKERLTDSRTDRQAVETRGVDAWFNAKVNLSSVELTTTLGVETFEDTNQGTRNGGALTSFPDGTTKQTGVYGQVSLKAGDWTLTPGVRVDSYESESSVAVGSTNRGQATSGKLYAGYEFRPGGQVFAAWGQAFNAPRLQDLYTTELHFPGNFFVPNPELKPESSATTEIGTKIRSDMGDDRDLLFSASVFETRAKDFISRQVFATTTQFQNLNRVRLVGFETSVQYQAGPWMTGLAYGQVRSEDELTGDPLADTSADAVTGRVSYQWDSSWRFGTDLRQTFKQDRVPATVSETEGYFVQDVALSYQRGRGEVGFRINNLHDLDYRRHGSAIREVGRDLKVTTSWVF